MMNFSKKKSERQKVVNIYLQTGFSHDGDGALSFVTIRIRRGEHQEQKIVVKPTAREILHSSKILMIVETPLMVCLPRQLRSRFHFYCHCFQDMSCPADFPFTKPVPVSSKTNKNAKENMKNWWVYLCFHMRPVTRSLKIVSKKIFSWNELLLLCFHVSSSTMGNNGLKLIQLFHRGREKKIIWLHS